MAKDPLMQAQKKRLPDINSKYKDPRNFKKLENEAMVNHTEINRP